MLKANKVIVFYTSCRGGRPNLEAALSDLVCRVAPRLIANLGEYQEAGHTGLRITRSRSHQVRGRGTGYYSAGNVAACEASGIDGLIAVKRESHHLGAGFSPVLTARLEGRDRGVVTGVPGVEFEAPGCIASEIRSWGEIVAENAQIALKNDFFDHFAACRRFKSDRLLDPVCPAPESLTHHQ